MAINMTYSLIDTHCHLDIIESQGQEIPVTLKKSKEAGVDRILQIGINFETSLRAIQISSEFSKEIKIDYSIGCHPADDFGIHGVEQIENLIQEKVSEPNLVGIGEIGLDYFHKKEDIDFQKSTFRRFLELASNLSLPVIIHSRDAAEDTYKILKEFKSRVFGVIHCFTYDTEYAIKYSDLGFYISFSGIVAFKNATAIQEAVRVVPLDSILIETDAPFLAPPPNRGKRNDPSNLPFVLEKIFSLRKEKNLEVQEKIFNNSLKFLSRRPR